MKLRNVLWAKLAILSVFAAQPSLGQTPLGTAFTYQGRLENAGVPASGLHDLQFQLFTAAAGGTQVGGTVCMDAVNVVDGLFSVPLDFGAAFDGNARFMQILVRQDSTPANCAGGAYTTLNPRQPLTATPYALKVPGIDGNSLNAADGSPVDAVFVDNNGWVGIGTLTPTAPLEVRGGSIVVEHLGDQADLLWLASERSWVFRQQGTGAATALKLENVGGGGNKNFILQTTGNLGIGTSTPTHTVHIANAAPTLAIQDTDSTTQQVGYVSYRDSTNAERAWVGYGSAGDPDFSIVNARPSGDIVLRTFGGGKVGIGTSSPAADLDVAGTARVQVLEITGADIAEKFPASETLEPGMVVAIDAKNAGKLCLSRGAYNRCVAGVVSGANNFAVGAVLGHLPGNEDAPPVALSGRVYVRCDGSTGGIEPGDLLTTSDTPGHAMKATDRDRSHGAVIGKAMERLPANERGLVLVLVNLQ